VTEIYDYLRLLFARIGVPHCPKCGSKIASQSADSITETIMKTAEGKNVMIMGPVIQAKKGTYEKLFDQLKQDGFSRIRLDGEVTRLDDEEEEEKPHYPRLDRQKKHTIEVIVDRLKPSPQEKSRLFDSIQSALKVGGGGCCCFS
jgi:excinuclease ABC subunit A